MDYNYDNNNTPVQPQPEEKKGMSIASLVLGICGIVGCCLPILGYPVAITGLVLGIIGKNKGAKNLAIAGIIVSSVTLGLTLINSILGVIMALNGQLF